MVTRRRWAMLVLFLGFSACSGAFWCTYAPIASQAAEYYDVQETAVDLFEMAFLVIYFPTAPLTTWLLNKSLYWSLLVANLINAIGGILRVLSRRNFYLAFASQCLLSTVNCMALVASATIAEVWFPPNEKVLSTTFASLANFIGVGIGMLLPCYLTEVPSILLAESAAAVFFCLFYIAVARKDPERSPHVFAWHDIGVYMRQWRSLGVILLCGSAIGTSYTLIGLFQQILSFSGYSTVHSSWAGLLYVLGGMSGGLVATVIVAYNGSFSLPLRIYIIIALAGVFTLCFLLSYYVAMLMLITTFGFAFVGFVPLAVRMGVIDAYPLDESVPTNMMFTSAQVFSLLYTYPVLYFQIDTGISGMWGITLCAILSFIPLFFACGNRMEKSEARTPGTGLICDKPT